MNIVMSRRRLLGTASVGALAMGLGACQAFHGKAPEQIKTAADYVSKVGKAILGTLTAVANIAGIDAATVAKLSDIGGKIQSVADNLATATLDTAQKMIPQFEALVDAALAAVAKFNLDPTSVVGKVFVAIQLVAPAVETVIGILAAPRVARVAVPAGMTIADAIKVLDEAGR